MLAARTNLYTYTTPCNKLSVLHRLFVTNCDCWRHFNQTIHITATIVKKIGYNLDYALQFIYLCTFMIFRTLHYIIYHIFKLYLPNKNRSFVINYNYIL